MLHPYNMQKLFHEVFSELPVRISSHTHFQLLPFCTDSVNHLETYPSKMNEEKIERKSIPFNILKKVFRACWWWIIQEADWMEGSNLCSHYAKRSNWIFPWRSEISFNFWVNEKSSRFNLQITWKKSISIASICVLYQWDSESTHGVITKWLERLEYPFFIHQNGSYLYKL